jgi:DNA-binding MarR family transcriptional regulator
MAAQNPVIMEPSDRILLWDLFHRSQSALGRAEDKLYRKMKLTAAQYDVLLALAGMEKPVTVNSLSNYLYRSSNSVTMILDRMESNGFVKRTRNLSDRRATRVALTLTGRESLVTMRPAMEDFMNKLTKDLSREDLVGFRSILEKVCQNCENSFLRYQR